MLRLESFEFYYNKFYKYYCDKMVSGEITEEQMEHWIDKFERMNRYQLRDICKRRKLI